MGQQLYTFRTDGQLIKLQFTIRVHRLSRVRVNKISFRFHFGFLALLLLFASATILKAILAVASIAVVVVVIVIVATTATLHAIQSNLMLTRTSERNGQK